jgi:hypothetical protein
MLIYEIVEMPNAPLTKVNCPYTYNTYIQIINIGTYHLKNIIITMIGKSLLHDFTN